MTGPSKTGKPTPKLEFFSKRVGIATAVLGGAILYWFSYRPYKRRQKHLELEAEAQEYWRIHKHRLEETK